MVCTIQQLNDMPVGSKVRRCTDLFRDEWFTYVKQHNGWVFEVCLMLDFPTETVNYRSSENLGSPNTIIEML